MLIETQICFGFLIVFIVATFVLFVGVVLATEKWADNQATAIQLQKRLEAAWGIKRELESELAEMREQLDESRKRVTELMVANARQQMEIEHLRGGINNNPFPSEDTEEGDPRTEATEP